MATAPTCTNPNTKSLFVVVFYDQSQGPYTTPRPCMLTRFLSFSSSATEKRQDLKKGFAAEKDDQMKNNGIDHRLDRMTDSFNDGKSSISESSHNIITDENDSTTFDVCESIDECMFGLHTCIESKEHVVEIKARTDKSTLFVFDHDWILDGSDSSEGEDDELLLLSPKSRRRRKFGDPALDQMLGMLEIENASYTTSGSSCGSLVDGEKSSPGKDKNTVDGKEEEVIEFADFSQFDSYGGICDDITGHNHTKGGVDSVAVFNTENNLQNDILYEYEKTELCEDKARPVDISNDAEEAGRDETHTQVLDIFSSPGYRPPQSIECLVSHLDQELDVTIGKCLSMSPDKSSVTESEGSSSHNVDCANLLDALNEDNDATAPLPATQKLQKEYKQPLLMSSILLESLRVPMPSFLPDDPVASLTRRVQQNHVTSKVLENGVANSIEAMQTEDKLLKEKLSDIIHSGYYSSAVDECDSDCIDSIVLEEVLNVPWPFHEIDLQESFLNEEESDLDSDDSESIDHLNFDTYISNRLSELDFATAEVMGCILTRVSQKEDAINKGVENIFAAELDIHTALLFSKSSREFLHRAKSGYKLPDTPAQHNVVTGGLDVLHYADSKDRLRDLMETIDQISSICDQEAQWWIDLSAKMIAPHRFQQLVDETRNLQGLVRGEEVLNHATSLVAMRDRINNLPEALLGRVEESLADLFARMLKSDNNSPNAFDEYFLEYESLLQSWLSCWQLKGCNNQNAAKLSQPSIIGAEWSSCILKILCFEASIAKSLVDSYYDERAQTSRKDDHHCLKEIESELGQIKFDSKDEQGLESLSHRLLMMRLGGNDKGSSVLSSTFFYLCSRLVELMTIYDVTLQWHNAIIDRIYAADESSSGFLDVSCQPKSVSESNVSSISSEKQSLSSTDEVSINEELQDETSTGVPENLEFKRNMSSDIDEYKAMHKSAEQVRRALWKECETTLINLIEFYMTQSGDLGNQSGDGTDFATGNLRLTYVLLLQFISFSSHFLNEDKDGEDQCSSLEHELSKLYQRHVRSVHIEAMKTTGTLLRHESWQLAPLELAGGAFKVEANRKNCRCGGPGQNCAHCKETLMPAMYQAVGDLLLGSSRNEHKSEQHLLITARSEVRGYRYCTSFGQFLDNSTPHHSTASEYDTSQQLWGCCGISSEEFTSTILSFVETKPCGERAVSILTQSSANGLVKWTARLLSIGNALPLVADNASDAVMTLCDLYILTVFRFCARSKPNEDVLIGFGRGTTAPSASSTSVSLTMEADAVAPLPREGRDFVQTQEFIRSSRQRLESLVNLDKFQSSHDEMCPTSPRSKNTVSNVANRLEKEAAAAYSCFFVAILVDVASKIFNEEQNESSHQQPLWTDLKDMATLIEKNSEDSRDLQSENSLETYATAAVTIMPTLVTQATRFSTVSSISGRDLIFQIICCGRDWDNHRMKEQSNAYVDDLCERAAFIWGYMASSMRLSPPAMQYIWNQLVWSAFMLLLEGFSKIANCSTEGRSLMSMDLATLSHGFIPETVQDEVENDHPSIGPPPHACREEMMRYVDTFIKVFYYPNEDIINWIKENSGNYHLDHSLSLVTSKAAGSKDKRFMTHGKKSVVEIYDKLK